jgi:hypothetical protein
MRTTRTHRVPGFALLALLSLAATQPALTIPAPLSWHLAHVSKPAPAIRGINSAVRLLTTRSTHLASAK